MKKRVAASVLLIVVLVAGFGGSVSAANAPVVCAIQTYNGHYLTAVGGGGRTTDVVHTDATAAKSWERFTLVDLNLGTPNITYGIRTKSGNYLTAVGGGGRIQDVLHSDATQASGWEQFQLESLGGGFYAIKTFKGYYLTAVSGGGRTTDPVHTDATQVQNWEKFRVNCG